MFDEGNTWHNIANVILSPLNWLAYMFTLHVHCCIEFVNLPNYLKDKKYRKGPHTYVGWYITHLYNYSYIRYAP
jgi:hypothetical protein